MRPISRLNASRIIARVDQQEAGLVEQIKDWLRSKENQARFDELVRQCSNRLPFRIAAFHVGEESDKDLLDLFALHGMNMILSKILSGWIAEFDEEGSSDE